MINLQLTIQEAEAVIKHIEDSARALIAKIHAQAAPQVQALQQQAQTVATDVEKAIEPTNPTA
jgi:nucleoside-triphosphatase THEP1